MSERKQMDALVLAAAKVVAAIEDEGERPDYHQRVMSRHRQEWPSLWDSLDELRAAIRGLGGVDE